MNDTENPFFKAVEQAVDGVLIINERGKVLYANPAALDLLGLEPSLGLGMDFGIPLVAGETTQLQVMSKTQGLRQVELRQARTDWQGQAAWVAMLRDVSEREQAAKELEEANQKLEQRVEERTLQLQKAYQELKTLDQLKDEFLTMTSHEFRTPLASILGYAEAIMDLDLERKEQIRFSEVIVKEATRMTLMIENILDLAAIKAGKFIAHLEQHQISDLVNRALPAVEGVMLEKAGLSLDLKIPPLAVVVDQERMVRVLINLFSNAIKHAPDQSKILVHAQAGQGEVLIRVKDQGPGIPPELKDHVFEPFYRVQGKNQPIKGTGLGLAIVKSIVEAHQGKIWLEDCLQGCSFVLSLPTGLSPGLRLVQA